MATTKSPTNHRKVWGHGFYAAQKQNESKPQLGSMLGRWFHSFNDKGEIKWQGQVVSSFDTETYLVQLYSWMDGAPTNQEAVAVSEMKKWHFYETDEQMRIAWAKSIERKTGESWQSIIGVDDAVMGRK